MVETEELTASPRADALLDAAELLQRMPGMPSLPVRDPETGRVLAVLVRPEHDALPVPPRLGGMATPLGVYLTDGSVSGGAGFWGLFLTGITLGTLVLVAGAALDGLIGLAAAHGFHLWAWVDSPSHPPALRAWLAYVLTWLPAPMLFVLLRLIPMSGTHAAEHQVVHCVEKSLPLVPECVRAQPRVHPRCGTNIFVGISLFLLVFVGVFCALPTGVDEVADNAALALVAAAVPTLLLWRRVGGFMQHWFATRPATDAQIFGAIRAAEQVLSRRRAAWGPRRFAPLRRIWTMGLAQVACGYFALYGPLLLALDRWPRLDRWLGFL